MKVVGFVLLIVSIMNNMIVGYLDDKDSVIIEPDADHVKTST